MKHIPTFLVYTILLAELRCVASAQCPEWAGHEWSTGASLPFSDHQTLANLGESGCTY